MKKVFVLGLLLLLAGCGNQVVPVSTGVAQVVTTGGVYRSAAGFRLVAPTGWIEEDGTANGLVIFVTQSTSNPGANLAVTIDTGVSDLASYRSGEEAALQQVLSGYRLVSATWPSNRLEVDYQGTMMDQAFGRKRLMVLEGDKVYNLTFTSLASWYGYLEPAVEGAFTSFVVSWK